jgi:lysozyme family protein
MTKPKLSKPQKYGTVGIVGAIIAAVFAVEGGFVNNPKDPGGATNHGITEQVAKQHGYKGDMRDLSKDAAASIYYQDYIQSPGFDKMIELSPAVAEKLIDAGVLTGPSRPSKWFQTSLNALNRDGKDFPQLTVDGKVGPGTISAYRSLERVRGKVRACELTLKLLDAQQAMHFIGLTNLKTFTPGWIDNRIGNVPLAKCTSYGDDFHVAGEGS